MNWRPGRLVAGFPKEGVAMNSQNESKTFIPCPSCGKRIGLKGKAELGRRIICTHCGVELKVIKAEPLTLSKVYRD